MNTETVLILSANPSDTARLRLEEEVREISEGIKRSKGRELFNICQAWAVRVRDIRRAMLDADPHIVHFCGHGSIDGIAVEDENGQSALVNPEALAGLFELFSGKVKCVVLNACYSELQAKAINKYVPYVIGMHQGIEDKSAVEFAVGFYDALGAGKTIEEAFRFGQNAIDLSGQPDNFVPVLIAQKKSKAPVRSERVIVPDDNNHDVLTEEQTFYPPPETGDIYILVRKKNLPFIDLSIEWGVYQKAANGLNMNGYKGVVLHLKHYKPDSISIDVKTNGEIVDIRQYLYGNAPPEWRDNQYKQISW